MEQTTTGFALEVLLDEAWGPAGAPVIDLDARRATIKRMRPRTVLRLVRGGRNDRAPWSTRAAGRRRQATVTEARRVAGPLCRCCELRGVEPA